MRLVYDARDQLSVVWIERIRARAQSRGEPLEIVPGDTLSFVDDDEESYEGAHALFRALGGLPLRAYLSFGLFGTLADAGFAFVRAHPRLALGATRLLVGRDVRPTRQVLVRFLFLRLLGAVSTAAFASAMVQLDGLLGARGIAPAVELAREVSAPVKRQHLSLFWLHPTDGMLHGIVWGGLAASILLALDVAPALSLLCAWACYHSLVVIGGVFFQYQWDSLLLESFLVAAFVVPLRVRPRLADPPPHRLGIWIVRLLPFKLMLLSGLVKLMSGDRTWRDLTALDYHHWTQPLPTAFAPFVAHLPPLVHHLGTAMTLLIEIGAPFLVFGPRRLRWLACLLFVLLQLGISASGNYGFFNALTVVLSLSLLDDDALERWVRLPLRAAPLCRGRGRRFVVGRVLGAIVIVLSLTASCARLADRASIPRPLLALERALAPVVTIHAYGLFAVMTTERPAIEIEGSADGVTFQPYVFRYQPGPVERRPRFIPLHLPRLDWQMWFAALGERCDNAFWYPDLLRRLLEGSPEVRGLFESAPFASKPPLFLRSTLYSYRPAPTGSQAVWQRSEPRAFCPMVTLQGGQLLVVE